MMSGARFTGSSRVPRREGTHQSDQVRAGAGAWDFQEVSATS